MYDINESDLHLFSTCQILTCLWWHSFWFWNIELELTFQQEFFFMYLNNPVLMQNYDSCVPTKVQTTKTKCQILYHLEIFNCEWDRFCQKLIHRSTVHKWKVILSLKGLQCLITGFLIALCWYHHSLLLVKGKETATQKAEKSGLLAAVRL